MSIRSALLATVTSIVLMLALGNEWAFEKAVDGGEFARNTRGSISGSLRWQIWEVQSDVRGATAAHLVVLIALTFVLCGIAGRSRGLTAFVGGWAAFLTASVISLGVYGMILDQPYGGYGDDAIDRFTGSASFGVALGMWLGWIVGLAVMLGSSDPDRTPPARRPGAGAPAPTWSPSPGADQPGYPPAYPPPAPPPPAYNATGPNAAGPTSPPPPPPPGGPVIGTPPDRTQVYGDPTQQG